MYCGDVRGRANRARPYTCTVVVAPVVSVIVPTYNRPDTLRVAIESVRQQSFDAWELRVVGDRCDPRTAEVVRSFDDERITYTNLPVRFGEQSGPCSIGIALASGSFVAFLNHDDVWLQDHLQRALRALTRDRADFFVGRSLFARRTKVHVESAVVPVFSEINPRRRFAIDSFTGHPILFEPASAWVVRTVAAQSVGNWRPAARMHRMPVQEWVLRAWRNALKFTFSDLVTVLKVVTHYQDTTDKGNYERKSPEHEYLRTLVKSKGADEIRDLTQRDLEDNPNHRSMLAPHPETGAQRLLHRLLVNSLAAAVYRLTGVDGFELYGRFTRRERGDVLRDAIKKRTGDTLPEPPDISSVLARIQAGEAS